MAQHPIPIAETSGPSRPSRRVLMLAINFFRRGIHFRQRFSIRQSAPGPTCLDRVCVFSEAVLLLFLPLSKIRIDTAVKVPKTAARRYNTVKTDFPKRLDTGEYVSVLDPQEFFSHFQLGSGPRG